jgi:hypothetical protein
MIALALIGLSMQPAVMTSQTPHVHNASGAGDHIIVMRVDDEAAF